MFSGLRSNFMISASNDATGADELLALDDEEEEREDAEIQSISVHSFATSTYARETLRMKRFISSLPGRLM